MTYYLFDINGWLLGEFATFTDACEEMASCVEQGDLFITTKKNPWR